MANPYQARPWLRFYQSGVPVRVEVPEMPVTALLDQAVRQFPRRAAVVFLGRSISYRKLAEDVDRFADALAALGVRRGDRVALVLPNCPQLVIAFYATLRIGGIVVPCNPLYTADEHQRQFRDSGAQVVIALDRVHETVDRAASGTDVRHVVVASLVDFLPWKKRMALRLPLRKARKARRELEFVLPDDAVAPRFAELLDGDHERAQRVRVEPVVDVAVLQYTGGTTGTPKGAMLTHRNLVANAVQAVAWDPKIVPGQEVTLAVVPLFHVFGLTFCLTAGMHMGGTLVLIPRFDVDMVLAAAKKYEPTIFPGVPPIFAQLAAEGSAARRAKVGRIRTCIAGAMAMPRSTVEAFRHSCGGRVVQGYGMTEASPAALANPLDGNARHISIGLPLPSTEARVADEKDPTRDVPIGYPGELLVRGPQVFAGYWNQPDATREALYNGWLRTGDIAAMSPDGFFTLIDRKRDVIIVNGLNVYPSEVEEVINAHPDIADSAVLSIPDLTRGEAPLAFVVPNTAFPPSEGELITYCTKHLADYKVPVRVVMRTELPRTMLGKVLRRVLREELAAQR